MQLKLSAPRLKKLKSLVKQYEKASTSYARKNARQKMQKLGFRMTDFGIRGITSVDLEQLLKGDKHLSFKGDITQIQSRNSVQSREETISADGNFDVVDVLNTIVNSDFIPITANQTKKFIGNGFYCLRLKADGNLPQPIQRIFEQKSLRIVYFGKAEDQTLSKRIEQELYAKGHGTFFRGIGAVLGFTPEPGSLVGKSNQYNYVFNLIDKQVIISWIESNLEICVVNYRGDFCIEKKIIGELRPLLNITHNPFALKELSQLKDRCRQIARNP